MDISKNMIINEVRDVLTKRGFKVWECENDTSNPKMTLTTYKFQKRIDEEYDVLLCQCNDKTFMNVELHIIEMNQGDVKMMSSITFSIHGEKESGDWTKIERSIDVKDLQKKYVSTMDDLVKMFNVSK